MLDGQVVGLLLLLATIFGILIQSQQGISDISGSKKWSQ